MISLTPFLFFSRSRFKNKSTSTSGCLGEMLKCCRKLLRCFADEETLQDFLPADGVSRYLNFHFRANLSFNLNRRINAFSFLVLHNFP